MKTKKSRRIKKGNWLIISLLIINILSLSVSSGAQNLGLTAVSTHSGGGASASGYGPELYNNGVIPTPYTLTGTYLWGWVSSNGWIEYTWSSAVTFDKVVFYKANRPMYTCTFQYWNGSAYVDFYSYNSTVINDSVTFPAVTTTKLRFYNVAGSSNPNFMEIEVYLSKFYKTDAAIAAIDSPAVNIVPAVHLVSAKIKNYGYDTLKSATIDWSVDGNMQTSLPWTGALIKNQTSGSLTLGNYNFTNGSHNIKVWVSNPNGLVDSNKLNDTARVIITVCNLLSGTFTIDKSGNGDFVNISSAVSALSYCGVNGPVTFRIRPGTYSERVVITTIPGASLTNTVTFDGGSADSTKISFNNTANSTTAYSVIALNGADYVTIKNLTIENTNSTSYASGVYFGNKAEYNTVENCIINLSITTTYTYAVAITGSSAEASPTTAGDAGNYNTFKNNLIVGGYYGIRIYGLSTSPYSLGNKFIGNTIQQFYYYGTYIYYQKNSLFQYNKVIKPRYAFAYGVYAGYNYNSTIDANIINPGAYGMYIVSCQNVAPDSGIVSNNIITNYMNGTYQQGIYLSSSYRIHVLNNSIWSDGTYTTTTSYACIYNTSSQNCSIKNNILKATGNLNCYVTSGATMQAGSIDYNDYVTSTTATVAYTGTAYKTLALWRLADQTQNSNSISQDPYFVDYTDLHLQASSPLLVGLKMLFQNDVDGDVRCAITTTLGADEYPYPAMQPVAGFKSYDTTCENSPVYCWNNFSSNDVTMNSWFVNKNYKASTLNFSYIPGTSGIDTVTVVTANCFGVDTFSKTIEIVPPTKTPVSDFVTNRNRVKIGEMVHLSDLSVDCPSAWEWNIMPDTTLDLITGIRQPSYSYVNGTNKNSANPELQFNYSGFYDVSLRTQNSIGVGTTETKKNYISVVFTAIMCAGSNITEETEGYLYDNGGKSGNYTANKLCTYTIHPCAATVSINFPKFNLSSGDYVRIYDGTDNKGTPLWNKKSYPSGMGNAIQGSFPTDQDLYTAASGAMYIEFETDATLFADGFEAVWTSTQSNFTPPVASFTTADSNCNGSNVFFENTSTGNDNKYFWDFDNSGQFESRLQNPVWAYHTDGIYQVNLIVVNCGGTDTASKNILIFTSQNKPAFEAEVSNSRPNMAKEEVYLSAYATAYCVDTFIWQISPNSYTIASGNINSQTIGIIFSDSVCYDVTLISGYAGVLDTIFMPCFIRPIEYCLPNFSYFTPDIGISRVTFNDIDQVSDAGIRPYEDFTSNKPTLLEHAAIYPFSVSRTTNYNSIQRKIWIDYNIDGDFEDPGELVAYDSLSNSLTWTGFVTIPSATTTGLSRLRVGVAAVGQNLGSCSILFNGEYEDYSVILSTNITPSIFTLIGPSVIHVPQCSDYVDPGAIAINNITGIVPVNATGTVNTQIPGVYYLTYSYINPNGIKSTDLIRTVFVDLDKVAPEINLSGKTYDTLVVHNSYIDPGYTAFDTCSGLDRVDVVNTLNNNILGSYTIEYRCFDNAGNLNSIFRHIEVIDNISPVITVYDPDTIFMEVNTALNPRVLKITDNYYTTFSIITSGTFYQNFNTGFATSIGNYTIIYDVYDGSGNKASKTFWIEVADLSRPSIVLNGSRIMNICRYDTIIDPGYEVEDNVDPNPKVLRSGSYFTDYLINFGRGTYEIQYTATDYSNNYSYISRLIYVKDSAGCASSISDANSGTFTAYPNPTSGLLNIVLQTKQNFSVEIYNMLGKLVYRKEFRNVSQIQIDLGSLPNGIYNLSVTGNDRKYNTHINLVH